MIKLTEVYKKYFQKSAVFLYPALGIPKSSSVKPIQTYISCDDLYKPEDKKLLCLYYVRDDEQFKAFEKNKLRDNLLFEKFIECEEDKGLYVFDFSSFNNSHDYFVEGQYHKMDKMIRNSCLTHYPSNSMKAEYLRSYLLPHLYYEQYAQLLHCDVKQLEEVGTLCSSPNLDKENLKIKIKQNEQKSNNDDSIIKLQRTEDN